jgi:hypothetical protein
MSAYRKALPACNNFSARLKPKREFYTPGGLLGGAAARGAEQDSHELRRNLLDLTGAKKSAVWPLLLECHRLA